MHPAAALARSASARTISGFLPPSSRLGADAPSGRGGAGEAEVVGGVDDGAADGGARADDDVPQVGGQACRSHHVPRPQQGQRGLAVGLADHAVAGQQGRQDVTDREVERVVPRRDHPDHALRDAHLPHLGEPGHGAADLAVLEVRRAVPGVVAGDGGDLQDLLPGAEAVLAHLPLDQVDDLVLLLQQQVVEAQHHLGPRGVGHQGPGLLGGPGPRDGRSHVVGGGGGDRRRRQPVVRRDGGHRLGAVVLAARRGRAAARGRGR